MEGRKPNTSSISSELFGEKDSSSSSGSISSSTGIFSTVFPSTAVGKDSSRSESFGSWRKQDQEVHAWNPKQAPGDGISQSNERDSQSIPNKDSSSIYQHETVEPCVFSSSLYYGGRDIYSHSPNSQNTQVSGTPHIYKKDAGEDDPNSGNANSASRGNWWQGSLYY
ncbi:uncharacterized protein LOC143879999 [Tasmannia lanceolata]|uniref:uncharacterized protein LOC143879999 n=1 Tax=Tasmannia lanceolata TaxID=3420 RepID=UPI0040646230